MMQITDDFEFSTLNKIRNTQNDIALILIIIKHETIRIN